MAVAGRRRGAGQNWVMWAFWTAGVALLLVEMNTGMEYVEAGLQQNMANLLGWLPALGMFTLRMAEQSIWHWGVLTHMLQAVPLALLGLLLVALGLAGNKRTEKRYPENSKE